MSVAVRFVYLLRALPRRKLRWRGRNQGTGVAEEKRMSWRGVACDALLGYGQFPSPFFCNLTDEVTRPRFWRGRPRPRSGGAEGSDALQVFSQLRGSLPSFVRIWNWRPSSQRTPNISIVARRARFPK